MSVLQIPEEVIIGIESNDKRASWLLRIEIRCAAAWAEAYAAAPGSRILANKSDGKNEQRFSDDEADWRRAWIQLRAMRFGRTVNFDYRAPAGANK